MSQHTKTPWEVFDTSNTHKKGRVFITDRTVMLAELPKWGDGKDLQNAEFIVRAVNSHEALVKFMKDTIRERGFMSENEETLLREVGGIAEAEKKS